MKLTGRVGYFCRLMLHLHRIDETQNLPRRRCFGSGQGDTQQQVGLRFAAMKQDG